MSEKRNSNTQAQIDAYLVLQKATRIKEGDKVKVLRSCPSCCIGWKNSWTVLMNRNIGKTLTVQYISNYGIALEGQDYPFFVLEKIDDYVEPEVMIEVDGKEYSESTLKEMIHQYVA